MKTGKMKPFFERLSSLIHSIRFKLVLWFTLILAVILCAFSGFLFFNQAHNMQAESIREIDLRLTSLADSLTSQMTSENGERIIPKGMLRDTDVFILLSPDGQVLTSAGNIPAEQVIQIVATALLAGPYSNPSAIHWLSPESQHYVFLTSSLLGRVPMGNRYVMVFGAVLDPGALVRRFLLTLVAGNLLTLAIALAGGLWLADRAMRPVKTITQTARTIGETDLNRRLNLKSRDELGELANTFDGMLARLQAAFDRQRQFVADASHELRTPLTIVNLETSRALSLPRTQEEYQQTLAIIHSENDFMTSLVNDLLMLARMDAGQNVIEKTRLDLSDLVVETMERLTSLASRNGITLEAGSLPETPIFGDRQQLLQMLSNLVENAIKYTTGERKLVRLETGTMDGSSWVRVADTGPGIAPDHLPHLFDRFYRVDKVRNHASDNKTPAGSSSSSGLGLSIVQWIAKAHDAQVHVESSLGVGTTFEVRFKPA